MVCGLGLYKRLKSKVPWWVGLGWRNGKVMPILFAVELPLTIAGLALFGIADPDTYRTALWTEGSVQGWNSDPSELLYAAANYKPMQAPTPWNQFQTDWNVVTSVLSMFILLVKCVLYISHIFSPVFSAIVHSFVLALWLVAISQQAAPDYSDPEHPSKFPWYLERGCGAPVNAKVVPGCQMAIGSFVVTVCMAALFLTYIVISIRFAIPSTLQKEEAREEAEEAAAEADLEAASPDTYHDDKQFEYEMSSFYSPTKSPFISQVPVTPRTQAFHALEGRKVIAPSSTVAGNTLSPPAPAMLNKDLPLRHHISMGKETYESFKFS